MLRQLSWHHIMWKYPWFSSNTYFRRLFEPNLYSRPDWERTDPRTKICSSLRYFTVVQLLDRVWLVLWLDFVFVSKAIWESSPFHCAGGPQIHTQDLGNCLPAKNKTEQGMQEMWQTRFSVAQNIGTWHWATVHCICINYSSLKVAG